MQRWPQKMANELICEMLEGWKKYSKRDNYAPKKEKKTQEITYKNLGHENQCMFEYTESLCKTNVMNFRKNRGRLR